MNCPDCDSSWVSIEVGPTGTERLVHRVVRADEADRIELVRACWTCGWGETRVVSVDTVTVEPGDGQLAARARLLDELIEAASTLDRGELEAALTAMEARSEPDG